jgi:hypothetical protein
LGWLSIPSSCFEVGESVDIVPGQYPSIESSLLQVLGIAVVGEHQAAEVLERQLSLSGCQNGCVTTSKGHSTM